VEVAGNVYPLTRQGASQVVEAKQCVAQLGSTIVLLGGLDGRVGLYSG